MAFLQRPRPRPWAIPDAPTGVEPAAEVYIGSGSAGLEVVFARTAGSPKAQLPDLWKARHGGRPAPVLVALQDAGERIWLCGPDRQGNNAPIHEGLETGQAKRLCEEALAQPDPESARRWLQQALPQLSLDDGGICGLNNCGLLADHALRQRAAARGDWAEGWEAAQDAARQAVPHRDRELLRSLGYQIERCDAQTSILVDRNGAHRALAVLLQPSEAPEIASARFAEHSPISYAMHVAERRNLPWVLVAQGSDLRLYPVGETVGVGRRGRTQTYIACQKAVLAEERLAYLWLLFSADALAPDGSMQRLLEASSRFGAELADRLRERIYSEMMPALATGLVRAQQLDAPSPEALRLCYEMALTVLFRTLFIAYAEDRDLLPYKSSMVYRRHSLKQKARDLADAAVRDQPPADGDSHWQELRSLWQAVDLGNSQWQVPAYNGGLFSSESKAGKRLAKIYVPEISVPDEVMQPVLQALLLTEGRDGQPVPVDFRSLSVREFGTIYEGLLESELALAQADLALGKGGKKGEQAYVPAQAGDKVAVRAGEAYLHNRSGVRKASGSYYTPAFAVEHLLDTALEPALEEHLARLQGMDEASASEHFFDFRVADLSMGSGHFLVAALDRIETRFANYLAGHRLPGVMQELDELRTAAKEALAKSKGQDMADTMLPLDNGALLRRQIARRCLYGVDLNPLAVQLARLSLWIHSFVPGLPLSLLDHHLVQGNALVGIANMAQIKARFTAYHQRIEQQNRRRKAPSQVDIFNLDITEALEKIAAPLRRVGRALEASKSAIKSGRAQIKAARQQAEPMIALCDIVTASAIDPSLDRDFDYANWNDQRARSSAVHNRAQALLRELDACHLPLLFPEVFLRERSGFDVILGNPPWEKVKVERHGFWARHAPGLRGMTPAAQEQRIQELEQRRPDLVAQWQREDQLNARYREILKKGSEHPLGSGDTDLYKVFCWRFLDGAAADGGRIGVVLPRNAWAGGGNQEFRKAVFEQVVAVDLRVLVNTGGWVFNIVEPRLSIALSVLHLKSHGEDAQISVLGPLHSKQAFEWANKKTTDSAALATSEQHVNSSKSPRPHQIRDTPLPSSARHSLLSSEILQWSQAATVPNLPTQESVAIFRQMHHHPLLGHDDGTEWRFRPYRELDGTNDGPRGSGLVEFGTPDCMDNYFPVWGGKAFDIWAPNKGAVKGYAKCKETMLHLHRRRLNPKQHSPWAEMDASILTTSETLPCLQPRIVFRDVASYTNSRTLIACLAPPKIVLIEKAPFCLQVRGQQHDEGYLLGILSSLVLDWTTRRTVETKITFGHLRDIPIPRPASDDPLRHRIIQLAGRLACPDGRYAGWAAAVGVEHGPLPDPEKWQMIYELDAVVAHLYGLQQEQLRHIFETFHRGWNAESPRPQRNPRSPKFGLGHFSARLKATLGYYQQWQKHKHA